MLLKSSILKFLEIIISKFSGVCQFGVKCQQKNIFTQHLYFCSHRPLASIFQKSAYTYTITKKNKKSTSCAKRAKRKEKRFFFINFHSLFWQPSAIRWESGSKALHDRFESQCAQSCRHTSLSSTFLNF